MPDRYKYWAFVAAMLAVVGMAAWPLVAGGGLLNTRGGGDSPFLLQRVHQLVTAVSDGHFPVRWMPDANYGYGYPFYNFYAPLSIYIAAAFKFLGFGYVQAIQLAQVAGFAVAAWGMFALARRWFGDLWTAVLAAIAYTVAPFHMVNVYVRGDSLAEFWAMAFYPLGILTADKLFDVASCKLQVAGNDLATCNLQLATRFHIALFAVAYAALILSHNISALIFTPFLLLYLLIRWLDLLRRARKDGRLEGHFVEKNNRGVTTKGRAEGAEGKRGAVFVWKPILVLGLAGVLAVGLAAFFVVPALAEKDYTQLGAVTAGYFHFSNHFLGTAVNPAIQSSFLFDYNPDGLVAFRMGLVQTLAICAGVIVLFLARRLGAKIGAYRVVFILAGLALSTFMFLPQSAWLWEHVPLLDFTQFPWRFLSVQGFFGSLAVGAIGLLPWRRVLVPVTAVLLIIAALGNLHPDYLPLSDADVTAERLAQYEWFTGNIGTTIRYEYLPPTVEPRPFTSDWLNGNGRTAVKSFNRNLLQADMVSAKTTQQIWQIETDAPDMLIFPTLYWRGWEGQIDGEPVSLAAADGSGLVSLQVPAGVHEVSLQLKRTPLRLAAELVSVTAVLVVIGLFLSGLSPSPQPSPSRERGLNSLPMRGGGPGWGYLLASLGGLLLLILIAQVWPEHEYSQNDLTWDFAQMGYLHHDAAGVPFANGLALDHYEYSADKVRGGETLTVTLHWQEVVPAKVTVALYSPAVHWEQPQIPAVAADIHLVNGRTTTFQLAIPIIAPEGLFVPRVLVEGAAALTPVDLARGPLFLRPVLVTDTAVPFQRTPQLDVAATDVVQRDDQTLDVHLVWRTDEQISPNYNVNLRLTDARGQFLQLVDVQPRYGFQPSSLWPPGFWVPDRLALPLPQGSHEFPYILMATLYDVRQPDTAVLIRKLGELQPGEDGLTFVLPEPVFDLPADVERETAVFGDNIQLQGYQFYQGDDELDLTLFWQARAGMETSFTRFVHLVPADSDQPPVAQNDSVPQFGTYPTSQWQAGEIVADRVVLSTAGLPAEDYQLIVGFYETGNDGVVLEYGRYLLPLNVLLQ